MLLGLHVKNLALIEEEELSFSDGLNILTGETGAGKSILLGSVNLALGAKADRSLIRTGAEYALVELIFRVDNDRQRERLLALSAEPDEEDVILVKRKIFPNRSQCMIGSETVTSKQLRELSELLMDVYGQRENQRLLRRAAQLEVVDAYAGASLSGLLAKVKECWQEYSRLKKLCEKDEELDQAARARETDLLTYEISEIEGANLRPGEDEELEEQVRVLSSFRRIDEALGLAENLLQGGEENAAEQVGRALRFLVKVQGIDKTLDEAILQLQDADALLADAARSLSDYAAGLSFDPQEFAQLEERLDQLNHLKDKYAKGAANGTLGQVQEALAQKKERLEELSDYEMRKEERRKDLSECKSRLEDLCWKVSGNREKAAAEFCRKMTGELLDLNFNQVDFHAELSADENKLSANGWDEVTFYISMNPGEPPRPLDAIASGGELSRIMLALKTVFAGKDDIHTLIFDEIDSGISGQTAWKVAKKLGRLAADHQILCITHLPQIAAMEERHFLIEKKAADGRTTTHIRLLNDEESDRELGRMMGGEAITEAALASAREMKAMARTEREKSRTGKADQSQ